MNRVVEIRSNEGNQQPTEKLEESEMFSKVFHCTVAAKAISRMSDGRFIDANDRWLKLYGLTKGEAIGHTSIELNIWPNPEDREGFISSLEESGFFNEKEMRFRRKNGDSWIALMSAQVIELGGEEVILSSLLDITERKRAEEALEESEAKYRGLFENSLQNIGIYEMDRDENGQIVDWILIDANPALERQIGIPIEQIRGKRMTELCDGEASKDAIIRSRKIMSSGRGQQFGTTWRDRTYLASYFPIGKDRIAAIGIEITDQKRADETLRKSEDKFRQIFNSTNDAMFVTDLQGRFLEVNDAACQQLGYSKEELLELGPARITPPEIASHVPDKVTDTKEKEYLIFETVHVTKDGRQIPVELSTRMISYQGMRAILGVARDITERKRAEEELRRSNDELEEFAYVASHDLREPLRMISSYLDLLERKYEGKVLDEKAKEYLDYAVDGASRMQMLIDDILSYSRVKTKADKFSPINMGEVIDIALKDLKNSIEESQASITHAPLPVITADKSQMIMLLQNLIGNAIKFKSEERPRIEISSRPQGREWIFSVQDNGIGIPKEQQDRIFKMFQRLHTKEEYEGTGIGLAIAKKIVERHGGRIWVESEEGKGSTFFFTIAMRRQSR